ncbi:MULTISPECIES: bacteriocin [Lactococcus]|uniref:Bacteriocin n=1 Tax=Lactococcus petauri TaxID=1940789 RepID=A0A252CCX5_9LACT|nr:MULTISPECIES: bacteriocin [Lactococcus]OUK04368.1 bacteriocin [Lactococcus petauri]QPS70260.1 bacteriocin [Lactococcus garvieae]
MQKGDIIKLSNGQKATVVTADTDKFKNIIIVELEDHDVRVVDRETLTLAPAKYHDNFGSHSKIW